MLKKRKGSPFWHIDLSHVDPETGRTRRIRESTGTEDRKLAEAMHAEAQAALYRGTFIPSRSGGHGGSLTISRALDAALQGVWMLGKSPSTVNTAVAVYRGLIRDGWLRHDDPVSSLTQGRLESIQADSVRQGLKAATVNARMWVLRAIAEQAVKDGAVKALPTFPRNMRVDNTKMRIFSPQEEVRLLTYLSTDDRYDDLRDFLVVALDTGGRIGEIVGLRPRDIQDGRVLLMSKNYLPRRNKMTPRVSRTLASRSAHRGPGDLLWPIPDGASRRYQSQRIAGLLKEATEAIGIEGVTPHTTRHTFGTRLFQTGCDLRSAMALMGHRTPEQTLKYAKAVDATTDAAVSGIERFVTAIHDTRGDTLT